MNITPGTSGDGTDGLIRMDVRLARMIDADNDANVMQANFMASPFAVGQLLLVLGE